MRILSWKKTTLLIFDIALLYASLYLTILIRYQTNPSGELWLRHVIPFSLLFVIWIIVFFINNLYRVQLVKHDFRFYSYLVQNIIINTLIGFTFFYLAPDSLTSLRPIRVLVLLVLIYTVLFTLWRLLFYKLTTNKALANKVLLIGIHGEAIELAEYIEQNPQLGYTVALIINYDQSQIPETLRHIHHVKTLADLPETIRAHKIQTIVTTPNPVHTPTISRYLFDTLNLGLHYYNFPDFYENITGKVPIASLEKTWFLENLLEGNKSFYELCKRAQDICFSIFFGTISLPFIPLIVLCIKLTSSGPILFTQQRTGRGGKSFTAMKFRTMVVGAENSGPQWATSNDTRVTRIGRFLRKTRLDEVPQFLNIIRGEMSFVGPRPERPEFVSLLTNQIPYYKERLLIKPGLTGWAQINFKYGESVEDAITKLQYDLFYVKNRSFTLDLSIILKTINTVFNRSLGQ
ncbi:MAG: sugar transferase [Patescibacteria group bacterium]